jgi:hypothetical protein
VGKRNREKRAARKRDRQRRGPTAPRHGFAGPHGPGCTCGLTEGDHDGFTFPQSADLLADTLLEAAGTGVDAIPAYATDLSSGPFAPHERVMGTAAAMALATVIGRLWRSGWLPTDVWELTRRRADAVVTALLVDTLAADAAQYAPATIHERWAAQLRQLEADVWWNSGQPHLGQWAKRHGLTAEQALTAVLTLLAQLMRLPVLPRIVPAPGTTTRRISGAAAGVDQKVLARVRALLAKAESTQFPDEADALSAKAQELMNRHAFERALLDADTHKRQSATSTRLWLDSPYLEAKSHLVAAIAKANRCVSVFYPGFGFVAMVGEEMDLEITELLVTSLLVQATRAMVAEGSHITHAGTSRTRSFRQSFLVAYAGRVGERLAEASTRAHDPANDSRLLPVLAARSRAVEETFQEMFRHTVSRSLSASNGAGWHAGRAAADRADLAIDRRAVGA